VGNGSPQPEGGGKHNPKAPNLLRSLQRLTPKRNMHGAEGFMDAEP
jgi:hypothetical protein